MTAFKRERAYLAALRTLDLTGLIEEYGRMCAEQPGSVMAEMNHAMCVRELTDRGYPVEQPDAEELSADAA